MRNRVNPPGCTPQRCVPRVHITASKACSSMKPTAHMACQRQRTREVYKSMQYSNTRPGCFMKC
eukprot:8584426-Alexandrium_andersonii.AAC.1